MRWIQASLILVVLLIGLALSKAGAAEERPVGIDAGCGVAHDGLTEADSHPESIPSFNLADPFDSLILSLPFLAGTPHDGLLPSLDSLIPALALPVQGPSVAVIGRRRCPAGWPATAAGRQAWLQRFLF
jgi:hypothetical protein